jgi:adenylate kinase family enzyme
MTAASTVPFRVVVLGAPCSGKTTLAAQAAKEFRVTHLSFHHLCRLEYQKKSDVGTQWKEHMIKGEAFVMGMANRIVQPHLDRNPRFVLEGFPKRNDELDFLRQRCGVIHAVLLLDIPVEVLLARARSRLQCPNCWTAFIVATNGANTCPQCGTTGERRNDDSEPEFWKRLEDFEQYGEEMHEGLRSFSGQALRVSNVDDGIAALNLLEEKQYQSDDVQDRAHV